VAAHQVPVRLGIDLQQPVVKAAITLRIAPVPEADSGAGGKLLRNGGFEGGSRGWRIPSDGVATISTEKAVSGKCSLKITDRNPSSGSNVTSARIQVSGGGGFELRGQVFKVSGDGIGLYLRCLDRERQILNRSPGTGEVQPVISLGGVAGEWQPFTARLNAPAGTAFLELWLHSYNASRVEAYLDEFEIVPVAAPN
jgi:hypothetical protein